MTWGRVTTLYRWGCRGTGQPCTVLPSCLNPDGYSFKTDPHSSSPLALIRSAPPTGPVLSAFSCQEHSSSCYRSPQLHPKVAPRSKSQREPLKQESGQCPFPQSPSCPPPHPPLPQAQGPHTSCALCPETLPPGVSWPHLFMSLFKCYQETPRAPDRQREGPASPPCARALLPPPQWHTPPGTVRASGLLPSASPAADGAPLLASGTQPPQPRRPRRQSMTLCDPCGHTAGWERPEARVVSQATQRPSWKISLAPRWLERFSPPRRVRGPKDKSPPGMPPTQDAGAASGAGTPGLSP